MFQWRRVGALLLVLAVVVLSLGSSSRVSGPSLGLVVRDASGRLLPGAEVWVWDYTAPDAVLLRRSRTDSFGRTAFSMPAVFPRNIEVQVFDSTTSAMAVKAISIEGAEFLGPFEAELWPAASPGSDAIATRSLTSDSDVGPAFVCRGSFQYQTPTYYTEYTVVGEVHQVGQLETAFFYSTTYSNTIDVGYKQDYPSATGWSVNGTSTISSGLSTSLEWRRDYLQGGSYEVKTQIQYRREYWAYEDDVYPQSPGGEQPLGTCVITREWQAVRPVQLVGGTAFGNPVGGDGDPSLPGLNGIIDPNTSQTLTTTTGWRYANALSFPFGLTIGNTIASSAAVGHRYNLPSYVRNWDGSLVPTTRHHWYDRGTGRRIYYYHKD